METFLADLRHAVRSLRTSPTFTLVASLTLAVGIGATITSLSLIHWLVLRPIPGIDRPDELALVWSTSRRPPGPLVAAAAGLQPRWVSYTEHQELMRSLPALSGLAAFQRGEANLGAPGAQPRRANVHYVMPSYFTVLGVRPVVGRPLLPEDDAPPEGQPVAVISDELWAGLFNRDPGAMGKDVVVNGRPFTIVGVAPPAFRGIERLGRTDLWLPGRVLGRNARQEGYFMGGYYEFVARVATGATFAQAEAQLHAAFGALEEDRDARVFRGLGIPPLQRPQVSRFMRLTLAASLLVLVIACANVANLLLFRGLARRSMTAMQKVMGAGIGALIRRQLTEGAVLVVPAILAGLLLASWFTLSLEGARLGRSMEPFVQIPIVWSVVAVGAALALITALLAAVAPAVAASRTDPRDAIQGTARTQARGAARLRGSFAVIQLSLSLTLLVGALLLLGTLQRLNAIDPGFEPRGVLVLSVNPGDMGPSEAQARGYYRALLARLQAAPGLDQVAVAWQAPFVGLVRVGRIRPPGSSSDAEEFRVRQNLVSPDYLPLLQTSFVEGRNFTPQEFLPDSSAPRKVILSQSVARRLFGDRPAAGQVLPGRNGRPTEVVGVVEDGRWENLEGSLGPFLVEPGLMTYAPFPGSPLGGAVILVRSRLPDGVAAETVQRVAGEVDPRLPAYGVTSMPDLIRRTLADRILLARMLGLLAFLAVALAAVGLYGLVAYGVAAHTREFGIRIALGAEARSILGLVVREAALLGGIGVAVGSAGAAALSRLIANRLYGVSPLDPATYLLAAGVLFAVCLVAALLPARAATRVDPMVALRAE